MVFTFRCHCDLFFFPFLFIFFNLPQFLFTSDVSLWRLYRQEFSPLCSLSLSTSRRQYFSLSTSTAVALMNELRPSTSEGGRTYGLVTLACLTPPPCLRLTVIVSSITKFEIKFSKCSYLSTPAPDYVPLAEKDELENKSQSRYSNAAVHSVAVQSLCVPVRYITVHSDALLTSIGGVSFVGPSLSFPALPQVV